MTAAHTAETVDLAAVVDAAVLLSAEGVELGRNHQADVLCAGRPLPDVVTDESWTKLTGVIANPRTGVEVVTREGGTLDVSAARAGDGAVVLALRDVSRYTSAAAKLAVVTDQLSRRNRDLATLYEVSAQLSSTLNLAELGQTTCQLVGEYIGARAVAVQIGKYHDSWPADTPEDQPDGRTALDTHHHAAGGELRWWRTAPLESSERRLVTLIAGRAAIGFDNAVLHATVERQADHDALTGLRNRAGLARLLATVAYPAAVVMLDLDHFKQINDTHGHDVGDDVLIALARTFGSLRSADVPVRWGGEEFLILCPATTVDQARQAIDRMRERVASTVRAGGEPVTFSAGVAPLEAAEDLDLAVSAADAAMYRAKQNGRNRVE